MLSLDDSVLLGKEHAKVLRQPKVEKQVTICFQETTDSCD